MAKCQFRTADELVSCEFTDFSDQQSAKWKPDSWWQCGERPVTFWSILDAFRRRWIPTLAVGIPAALLVGALLWQLVPAEYESSALLKVHQFEQRVADNINGDKDQDLKTYRDTVINFLKSREVSEYALRIEGVKETRLLRDQSTPVDWLLEHIEVHGDFSPEFVRITLAGEHPPDLATIVDAIKDAYLDNIVYQERNERIQNLRRIETKFAVLDKSGRQTRNASTDSQKSSGPAIQRSPWEIRT